MDEAILIFSVLLFFAIFLGKFAGKIGIPTLLIFIVIGILAGSDGIGKIHFDNYFIAQSVGIIALSYILFMGGLSVKIKEIRPILTKGIILSTVGVLLTATITGALSHYFLKMPLLECFLIGAIVSCTDAAAVFSVLGSQNIKLKNNLKALLEFESGSNDPMAVFLTVGFIALITGVLTSPVELVGMFFKQMSIGIIAGYLIAKLVVLIINIINLQHEGLYAVITLATVTFAYSLPHLIHGNGFMAVYICGLTMSASNFVYKKSLMKFHDDIAWVMQIVLFLVLGLLVFVKEMWGVAAIALAVSLILVFIARPIAVLLSLAFFKETDFREKLFVAWVGLRGAVPIVLATFPLFANVENSHKIFDIVFFVVIISVTLQGTTIPLAVKLLKVGITDTDIKPEEQTLENIIIEIPVSKNSPALNKYLHDVTLPENSCVTMIIRDDNYIIPSNTTIIQNGDIIVLLTNTINENKLYFTFN